MAIIKQGEILQEAEPLKAVEELKGKIWRRVIEKRLLSALGQEYKIISTKLLSGKTVIHVYSEGDPGSGFELVDPDLEDVYFATMEGHGRNKPEITR
jgi:hypothetical protein